MTRHLAIVLTLCCPGAARHAAGKEQPETVRYTRPAKGGAATECTFVIARDGEGWTITSMTDRGAVKMEVVARYGDKDRLLDAKAVVSAGKNSKAATVSVADGRVTVEREGADPQRFEVPPGTIVTSAPDWTDVFLLCRRYDREGKEKQEFPALWIHPSQAAQRLTFTIERQGTDSINHDGKKLELRRFQITIRGGSRYVAWADVKGRMIRLIPLGTKGEPSAMLTLAGYEKSAAELRAR